ncbi:MAG: peptidylprolyl isomerase [Pedobacter sp.]|jgi:FKBP-type peptidyl-prolyl cis-trans isomerase FkpA|nr:MAG: peptidylprolyl isomerase [Pedobacter sp.]
MKKSLLVLFAASALLAACSKEKKAEGGALYTILKEGNGPQIKEGDYIKFDFIQKNDKDSILDATYDYDQSRVIPVGPNSHNGDMYSVLKNFKEGDSVAVRLNLDTMEFYNKDKRPEQYKDQKYLNFVIKIHKVFPKKENEADSTFQNRATEFFTKDYEEYKANRKKSEVAKMKKYAEENKMAVKTTPSGLMYVIENAGTDPKPIWGDTAIVDYTGQLTHKKISGKLNVFDTSVEKIAKENIGPQFVKPFAPTPIPLAENIAKGFVEALQLIGKGGKIKVIMPSALAYGEQGVAPQIAPYSPLVFDIEIKDIKKPTGPVMPPPPVAPAQ